MTGAERGAESLAAAAAAAAAVDDVGVVVVVADAEEWAAAAAAAGSASRLIVEEMRVSRMTGSPARCGAVEEAADAQIGVAKFDAERK